MLTIENRKGGYLLKEKGGPVSAICADRERLYIAIEHYYGGEHERANCPLCHQMAAKRLTKSKTAELHKVSRET